VRDEFGVCPALLRGGLPLSILEERDDGSGGSGCWWGCRFSSRGHLWLDAGAFGGALSFHCWLDGTFSEDLYQQRELRLREMNRKKERSSAIKRGLEVPHGLFSVVLGESEVRFLTAADAASKFGIPLRHSNSGFQKSVSEVE